ncbi:transposase [Planococcus salinarum]|uniref:transposase n=1 Tax=Planococcus salinarum TaxID=622695 RepID=UPI000E3C80A8|nr:hypothetical protein D2909_03390 [Planococcus salinarum]
MEKADCFICPNGRRVEFKTYRTKNASGYEQSLKIYACEDCSDCPIKALCTKSAGKRLLLSENPLPQQKQTEKKEFSFSVCYILRGSGTAPSYFDVSRFLLKNGSIHHRRGFWCCK